MSRFGPSLALVAVRIAEGNGRDVNRAHGGEIEVSPARNHRVDGERAMRAVDRVGTQRGGGLQIKAI